MNILKMNQTVYEITEKYPELIFIIAGWGFPQIKNPFLRHTIGSKFTIKEAIFELHLNRNMVIESLKKHNFELTE